jgi:hypothetical protein
LPSAGRCTGEWRAAHRGDCGCSPTDCWTLSVLPLFCLFLVDNAGLLALFALSFCNLRMGLLVSLWNHILGLRLVVGHNSPPVSGVNVTIASSVPVRSRSDDRRRRPTLFRGRMLMAFESTPLRPRRRILEDEIPGLTNHAPRPIPRAHAEPRVEALFAAVHAALLRKTPSTKKAIAGGLSWKGGKKRTHAPNRGADLQRRASRSAPALIWIKCPGVRAGLSFARPHV